MCPGNFVAKATVPSAPRAVYSVMKNELPPTTRLNAPNNPPPPPNCVVVARSIVLVIQESSPETAMTLSPGESWTSSTGIVLPMI